MPGVCIFDKSCRQCDILAIACYTEHFPVCVVMADHEVSCLTRGRLALNQCYLDLTRCLPFILLLLCAGIFITLWLLDPQLLFWSNRHSAAPRFYFYHFLGRYFCRNFIIHCLCAESASNEFKVTANKAVETKGNSHLHGADESPSVSAVPPHLFFISMSLCRGERRPFSVPAPTPPPLHLTFC